MSNKEHKTLFTQRDLGWRKTGLWATGFVSVIICGFARLGVSNTMSADWCADILQKLTKSFAIKNHLIKILTPMFS
jgi:hypothetical protein